MYNIILCHSGLEDSCIFLSKKNSLLSITVSLNRIGSADSSSDGRFVFGNGFEGAQDPQAGVVTSCYQVVTRCCQVVVVRVQHRGRLLRPGPSAVLRSRHRRTPRRGPRGGAGGVQRLEFSLKLIRNINACTRWFKWILHLKLKYSICCYWDGVEKIGRNT